MFCMDADSDKKVHDTEMMSFYGVTKDNAPEWGEHFFKTISGDGGAVTEKSILAGWDEATRMIESDPAIGMALGSAFMGPNAKCPLPGDNSSDADKGPNPNAKKTGAKK